MEYSLFSWGSIQLTGFGLSVMLAAAVSVFLVYLSMRGLQRNAWAIFTAWCLPLALLCARLIYCLARIGYIVDLYGIGFIVRFWEGGYSLWGAAFGCVLAGLITAKRTGLKAKVILDAAVPALLAALALCRFAEYCSGQGIGLPVENSAMQFFPLSVQNEYGEWYFAIFIAEGLTALITLWLSVRLFHEDRALKAVIIIAATQIVWESMRRDMFLRWGFVRVTQLMAVLVLFAIMLMLCIGRIRAGEKPVYTMIGISAFALLTGICIVMEFAMDKSPLPYSVAWLIMAACAAGMGALPWMALCRKMPAVSSVPFGSRV